MAKVQVLNDDGTVATELDCTDGHIALGVNSGGDAAWDLRLSPRDQRNFVADLAPAVSGTCVRRDRRALAVGAAALLARLARDEPDTVRRAVRHFGDIAKPASPVP